MISKEIKFRFKGSRDCIHGTDIFNEILAFYADNVITNLQLNIYEVIKNLTCKFYFSNDESQLKKIENCGALCSFEVDGEPTWVKLASISNNNAAKTSYPYDEQAVLSLCKICDDKIELLEESPYTFIETVVAMNKHLHHVLFDDAEGRWLFVRLDLPKVVYGAKNLSLVLKHNFNYRLTKSRIYRNNIVIGEVYFSLSK